MRKKNKRKYKEEEMKTTLITILFISILLLPTNTNGDWNDYPWRVDGHMVLVNNNYDITLSFEEMYSRFDNDSVVEINNYNNMYAYVVRNNIAECKDLGDISFLRLFYNGEEGTLIYQWTFYDRDSEELEKDVEEFHRYFELERKE